MNTTKEGIEVKPGQKWRDLDKRARDNRILTVIEVRDGKALCIDGLPTFKTRISIRRMHRHSTGFELVQ